MQRLQGTERGELKPQEKTGPGKLSQKEKAKQTQERGAAKISSQVTSHQTSGGHIPPPQLRRRRYVQFGNALQKHRIPMRFSRPQTSGKSIWLTTAQAGFPTTPTEDEVSSLRDLQLGRSTARHLHPEISAFIGRLQNEIDAENRDTEIQEDTFWEPNPSPLMVSHPPRITASNTRIQLLEGSLGQPSPKGEDNLGWDQLQTKIASLARYN